MLMFCWDFEVDAWSRFDQNLCLNLWYDPSKLLGQLNLTLRSFVPLAMFYTWIKRIAWQSLAVHIRQQNPDKSALIVRQGAGLVTQSTLSIHLKVGQYTWCTKSQPTSCAWHHLCSLHSWWAKENHWKNTFALCTFCKPVTNDQYKIL